MSRHHLLWQWCLASVIALSLSVGAPLPVRQAGAAAAESKIAFVDLGRAFDDYEKTKRLDRQLEEQSNAKQAERERLVTEIRGMKEELELLSEKGREDRQAAIDEKIQRLQEFDRQAREGLKRQRDDMVKDILKEIERVVEAYAQQHGYDLVLSDRAVLYAGKTADITDQVLQALNGPAKGVEKGAEKSGSR